VQVEREMGLAVMVCFMPSEYAKPFFVWPLRLGVWFGSQCGVGQAAQVIEHRLAPLCQVVAYDVESRDIVVGRTAAGETAHEIWRGRVATEHTYRQMPVVGGRDVHE